MTPEQAIKLEQLVMDIGYLRRQIHELSVHLLEVQRYEKEGWKIIIKTGQKEYTIPSEWRQDTFDILRGFLENDLCKAKNSLAAIPFPTPDSEPNK